jgi:DNA-binding TFAR19-related protein (PDSD5 family)
METEEVKKNKTTIQLEKETLGKLKELKVVKRESYDELINRLIEFYKTNQLKKPETTTSTPTLPQ